MLALFRNPFIRLVGKFGFWPMWLAIMVGILGGETGSIIAGSISAVYLAAIFGVFGSALGHGTWIALRNRVRRLFSRHRFLCPHCLNYGGFYYACGACTEQIEDLVVYTDGVYVNDCANCHELIFSRDGLEGRGVRAHCQWCHGTCDREIHHNRQIRVIGALRAVDFDSLCQITGATGRRAQDGVEYFFADDGIGLMYVLNLGTVSRPISALPLTHAVWNLASLWLNAGEPIPVLAEKLGRAVALSATPEPVPIESVWVDAEGEDPHQLALELGEAADRFIRDTELTEKRRRALTVSVHQKELHPAVQHVLESRFDVINYGVEAIRQLDVPKHWK